MPLQNVLEIVISGVGGQGNVRAAQMLGAAAVKAGYRVRVSDVFGIAQRGGPVLSHVRIGDVHGSMVSAHSADVVMGLEPMEALRAISSYLKPGGTVLMSTRPVYPVEVSTGKASYPALEDILKAARMVAGRVIALDATGLASSVGMPMAANVVMLGVLAGTSLLPFEPEYLRISIREHIPRGLEENMMAFEKGMSVGKEGMAGEEKKP